jgi:hypothetical protein
METSPAKVNVGMNSNPKIIAYIDGANLYRGVKDLGWPLDYQRFHVWLRNKYHIDAAYLFIGLVSANKKCSFLLRKLNIPIVYLDMIKKKVMKRP